ncbi:MAG: C-GCAxxG-C-C family protein [Erysipelotrichaceae bacterium]|nr:C-GCAxxG-C-C family protein [Erysipelotrichaceae bacterium]
MLRDELIRYYYRGNGYNYNCAESMLRACNDYFNLNLPDVLFYAASGYGGGMGHNELCGGLASAVSVLGVLYSVNGKGHDSPYLRELTNELFSRFEEKLGKGKCKELKELYSIPERRCEPILVICADVLEDIISRNEPVNRR